MIDPYITCDRCDGRGFAPLGFLALFRQCRACGGTGQRVRTSIRVWRMLRHGSARQEY